MFDGFSLNEITLIGSCDWRRSASPAHRSIDRSGERHIARAHPIGLAGKAPLRVYRTIAAWKEPGIRIDEAVYPLFKERPCPRRLEVDVA